MTDSVRLNTTVNFSQFVLFSLIHYFTKFSRFSCYNEKKNITTKAVLMEQKTASPNFRKMCIETFLPLKGVNQVSPMHNRYRVFIRVQEYNRVWQYTLLLVSQLQGAVTSPSTNFSSCVCIHAVYKGLIAMHFVLNHLNSSMSHRFFIYSSQ